MHPNGQGTVRLRFLDLYNWRPLRSTLSRPSFDQLWPPPSNAHLCDLLCYRFRHHNVECKHKCIRNRTLSTWHWRRSERRRCPNLHLGSRSSLRPRDFWVPYTNRDEHGHPHYSDPRLLPQLFYTMAFHPCCGRSHRPGPLLRPLPRPRISRLDCREPLSNARTSNTEASTRATCRRL